MIAQYPKRDGFFAGKFCRLMSKSALANELGTDVVCLLMVIVHKEDELRYRGAVTWWNDQLKPMIGVKTDNALIRTRKKAVDAGWLHYEPGGKGILGRYWVTIPKFYNDFEAVQTDDIGAESGQLVIAPATRDPTICPVAGARENGGIATGKEKGKKICHSASDMDSAGEATTILSLPYPNEESPSVSGASPPPSVDDTPKPAKKPRKEPTGDAADSRRAFSERWKAKYGDDYSFNFKVHGDHLRWMLAEVKNDVPRLIGIMERFIADKDEFYTGKMHLFEKLRQHFNRWKVVPKLPAVSSSMPIDDYANYIPTPRPDDDF